MAIVNRSLGQKLRLRKRWQIPICASLLLVLQAFCLFCKPFACFSMFSFYKASFRVYNIDTVYYYI